MRYPATYGHTYDGDTVHMDLQLFSDPVFHLDQWRRGFRYRLGRINAPEMATPEGQAAANALRAKCETYPVTGWAVETTKPDPYGRYIAEVYAPDGTNLSTWMLSQNLAVPVKYKLAPGGDHMMLVHEAPGS